MTDTNDQVSEQAPAASTAGEGASGGGPARSEASDLGSAFGVVTRGDSNDAPSERVPGGDVKDKAPATPTPAAAPAQPKEPTAAAPKEPDRSKPFTPEPDDPSKPFKFGGEQFTDAAQAEHMYKTVRGMLPDLYKKVGTEKSRADEQTRLATDNYNAAIGWKQKYDELVAQGSAAAPAAQQKPDASAPTSAAPQGIDWDTFEYLQSLPNIGLAGAMKWLHEENDKIVEARLAKVREELTGTVEQRLSPLVGSAEQNAAIDTLDTLIKEMATWTLPAERGGGPAYPELTDQAALQKIADLWAAAELDPQLLLTKHGLENAVFRYRAFYPQGHKPAAAAAPTTAGVPPAQPAAPAAPVPTSADTALAMGGIHPPSARPATPSTPEGEVRRRLMSVGSANSWSGVVAPPA
jgi:hypothetical protein